jgi:hypothetical protein
VDVTAVTGMAVNGMPRQRISVWSCGSKMAPLHAFRQVSLSGDIHQPLIGLGVLHDGGGPSPLMLCG